MLGRSVPGHTSIARRATGGLVHGGGCCSDTGSERADPHKQSHSSGTSSVAAPWCRRRHLRAGSGYIFEIPPFVLLEVNFEDEISLRRLGCNIQIFQNVI